MAMPNAGKEWDFPSFYMNAGETKFLRLPIRDLRNTLVDVSGMDGRLALSDYVTPDTCLFQADCDVVLDNSCGGHIFTATLPPEATVNLCGKYIYQLTARDVTGALGVLRGTVIVQRNVDKQTVFSFTQGG